MLWRWHEGLPSTLHFSSLQSPIFVYPWGYSILWISKPWRYPIPGWYNLHTIPPHTIPFHPSYHTIPYHITSYHTIIPKLWQGVWGPLYKIWKLFLQAAKLVHWAPFFVDWFFTFLVTFKLQVEVIGWTWSFKNQLNWVLSHVLPIYTLDSRLQYWSIGLHFCGLALHSSSDIVSSKWRLMFLLADTYHEHHSAWPFDLIISAK